MAALGTIPANFTVTVALNGETVATIETVSELPITIAGTVEPGDIPQIRMELDEDRVRDGLAEVLRAAADQIVGAS